MNDYIGDAVGGARHGTAGGCRLVASTGGIERPQGQRIGADGQDQRLYSKNYVFDSKRSPPVVGDLKQEFEKPPIPGRTSS